MSTYVQNDDILKPVDSGLPDRVKSSLPLGTYSVGITPEGYFLQIQEDFKLPPKIYGRAPGNADRILNTFQARPRSTGVLLSGEKGSGKTLLATMLSVAARQQGLSTLVVNAPYHGEAFNAFIQSIDEPCVVLFDEFEKVYHQKEWQSALLTLLDGTAVTKKLFVVTTNDTGRISEYMRNRPGRIFYALEYTTLEPEFIEEYCRDALKNQDHLEAVFAVTTLYDRFNFDMLKALVEEMNRYDEDPRTALRMLNIRPDFGMYHTYACSYVVHGQEFPNEQTDTQFVNGHPLNNDDGYCVDFYSVPRFEYDRGNKEHKRWQVGFDPEHLTHVDARKGVYEYENEGHKLILTKQPKKPSLWATVRAF